MANISAKETKPEITVRKFLFSRGFRYRKNVSDMPGKPDIVLKKYKAVIFVNGCFWHGHRNCVKSNLPKTNTQFWKIKIDKNVERDKKVCRELKQKGWRVINIWQCEIKNALSLKNRMNSLISTLKPKALS